MTGEREAENAAVAGELRAALSQLMRRLREQTEGSDLTKSQSAVLGRLEREGANTATALARAEGVRPQSMAAILAALEADGLIAGRPDPTDRRKTIVELTEKAHAEFRAGRHARQDWLTQAICSRLDPDEVARLAESVELLRRLGNA